MLQDIFPYRLHNEYLPNAGLSPDDSSVLVVSRGSEILCRAQNGAFDLPMAAECDRVQYLISVDGVRFYMPSENDGVIAEKLEKRGFSFVQTREIRYLLPEWLRFGTLTAWQLSVWYRENVYCSGCGGVMKIGTAERSVICSQCGSVVYPRINPVVIVGVIRDHKLLLTRYASGGAYRKYALVAGYCEAGETVEQTVCREVAEETGLHVTGISYYKSQPWAFSSSLLLGFFCYANGNEQAIADGNELCEVKWSSPEEIPLYENEISLTYDMMSYFKNGFIR